MPLDEIVVPIVMWFIIIIVALTFPLLWIYFRYFSDEGKKVNPIDILKDAEN